jgi:SPP1 family predicted phage head-tail adaptor
MSPVSPGELRWRVSIEQNNRTQAANGQLTESWSSVIECWARIRTPTGRELLNAQQRKATLSHVITIRYQPSATSGVPAVDPKMRVNYKGRIFQISAVQNIDERNRQLDLHCTEVVGQT